MSNDHSNQNNEPEVSKSKVSFSSSFWFIVILVVLFVSALNFVNVMSHDEEKKEPAKTETTENKANPEPAKMPETTTPSDTTHK